ncbi:MAG TPA: lysylphosphatidylglycerol synthase transmembrane domain-containing protein [Chloroflexota bacterium]|nr:lysylphosphatidylglycerol synthase transmembrane domain-containing protein [Chloroflexota bacterium]
MSSHPLRRDLRRPVDSRPRPIGAGNWLRTHWLAILGWCISAAGLWYVISRTDLSILKEDLADVSWGLIVAAVILQVVPKVLEAVRWQSLLRPFSARFWRLLRATYIGCLCSTILPLSAGELVRATLVTEDTGATLPEVLSTEAVERVVDTAAVVLVAWFALRGVVLPRNLLIGQIVLAVAAIVLVVAFVLIVIRRADLIARMTRWRASNRLSNSVRSAGLEFVQTIGRVRSRAIQLTAVASLGTTAVNIATYWLLLRAYHVPLSGAQAAALFAIVAIGTALPGAPGDVGSWQFFCAVGLELFGVSSGQATGFSLVGWAVFAIPPMLIGVVVLLASSAKWSQLVAIRPPAEARAAVEG